MNAFLIDPARRQIERVEFDGRIETLRSLIGFPTLESDEIGKSGDRLYFDEECFLRLDSAAGRFQLDTLAPVSGRAVVTGRIEAGQPPSAPTIDREALLARVKFL